jgi:hypothetical protein
MIELRENDIFNFLIRIILKIFTLTDYNDTISFRQAGSVFGV